MGKKRTEKRQPTAEESSRNAEHRMKRYLSKSAIEIAENDPETRRIMMAQAFGFKFEDPVEKSRGKLIALIDELAIQRIKDDPELARTITDRRIRQVMESLGLIADGEEWQKKPLSLDEMIEEFEKVNHLKEVLGIKEPGFFDALMDPKVITSVLSMISQVMGGKQPPAANGMLVMVQIDGKDKLVTMEEFKRRQAEGKVKPLDTLESEKPNNRSKGNKITSESETSNEADEGDGETGTAGSGK